MKKCSHSHHHALAELNITPLLDLAFVLLVIFIITTTPIVNDQDVDLPSAAKRPKESKTKVQYVTANSSGQMYLNNLEVDLPPLQEKWVPMRLDDPELNAVIAALHKTKYTK